jgi:hypothetical protein
MSIKLEELRLATTHHLQYRISRQPQKPFCNSFRVHVHASDIMHAQIAFNSNFETGGSGYCDSGCRTLEHNFRLHLMVFGRSHRFSESSLHHHELFKSIEAPSLFHSDFFAAAYIEAHLRQVAYVVIPLSKIFGM